MPCTPDAIRRTLAPWWRVAAPNIRGVQYARFAVTTLLLLAPEDAALCPHTRAPGILCFLADGAPYLHHSPRPASIWAGAARVCDVVRFPGESLYRTLGLQSGLPSEAVTPLTNEAAFAEADATLRALGWILSEDSAWNRPLTAWRGTDPERWRAHIQANPDQPATATLTASGRRPAATPSSDT